MPPRDTRPATPSASLAEALRMAVDDRWRGMRTAARNLNQAILAILTLERLILGNSPAKPCAAWRLDPEAKVTEVRQVKTAGGLFSAEVTLYDRAPMVLHTELPGASLSVADITKNQLKAAAKQWMAGGLSPASAVVRINCLSALGVDVTGCRPTVPRKLKWWLKPEQAITILTALRIEPNARRETLADLIEWTMLVGTRVEETLRIEWSDVVTRGERSAISVSGTKTSGAQATLPIAPAAVVILERRRGLHARLVFGHAYWEMAETWREVRIHLALADPKTATLKALRRCAARSLHASKGMPLDMVREYLRHENVQTTMGYLRLTGGYGEEEFGKWL